MNTNDNITALLHGELTDDTQLGELMHLLAVSPEKRKNLLEQIRLSRQLLRSGTTLPTPNTGVEGIWNQVMAPNISPTPNVLNGGATVAAGVNSTSTSASITATRERTKRRYLPLLLTLLFGIGGGLLLGWNLSSSNDKLNGDTSLMASSTMEPSPTTSAHSLSPTALSTSSEHIVKENVKVQEREGESLLNSKKSLSRLEQKISTLQEVLRQEQLRTSTLQEENAILRSELATLEAQKSANDSFSVQLPSYPTPDRVETRTTLPASELRDGLAQTLAAVPRMPDTTPEEKQNLVRVEARQFFRTSLPNVQGLDGSGSLVLDREVGVSIRLDDFGLPSRVGIAAGQTIFSQVFHTNTGGALNDTIIEQSPTLFYGRAYIAPHLFGTEKVISSAEIGGGGTELGPIGTIGLGVEYSLSNRVTLGGGVTSWLLWTSFKNQLHTSTNLTGHIGIYVNP
ncbi:MAG: hypothetical protein KDD67_17345 [Ignavibacteriae bacterium]|nr:hypothetical protein [Ignavibacteriota bacterium]MCB9217433.1 hypothetical protein [Ignavibacteria bacterium]